MHGRPEVGHLALSESMDLCDMSPFKARLGTSFELLSNIPYLANVKVHLHSSRHLSVQVYALIAIACMKLGKAIQLHSSRSEVKILLSLSKGLFCSEDQMSQMMSVHAVHLTSISLMRAHDVAR